MTLESMTDDKTDIDIVDTTRVRFITYSSSAVRPSEGLPDSSFIRNEFFSQVYKSQVTEITEEGNTVKTLSKQELKDKFPIILQRELPLDWFLMKRFPELYRKVDYAYLYRPQEEKSTTAVKLVIPEGITDIIGLDENDSELWHLFYDLQTLAETYYPRIATIFKDTDEDYIKNEDNLGIHLLGHHVYYTAENLYEGYSRKDVYSKDLFDSELVANLPRFVQVNDFLMTDSFNLYFMGGLYK